MKKINLAAIMCLLLASLNGFADENIRKCMLLPVSDNSESGIGFSVFQEVEKYLKESDWCFYRPNSEILNILESYKKNLSQHLENKDVIRVIAEKVKAGSLIKIDILKLPEGATVELKVYAPNGSDIYFKEKENINDSQISSIGRNVKNWLSNYSKTIPYDGQIIGVLGDQFTVDIGKTSFVRVGQEVQVKRPVGKREHPLLKEIVEWETEEIAEGRIINVSDQQAQGLIKTYLGRKKLEPKDWVVIDKTLPEGKSIEKDYPKLEEYQFGKLGLLGIYFQFGQGSASTLVNENKKMKGTLLGFKANSTIWITRDFFLAADFSKKFGTYKKETGSLSLESNSVSTGYFKVKGGYKYLPLGFFYGPQVDVYLGYGGYSYSMDTQIPDGFGDSSLKGILLGVKGDAPIHKNFRAFLKIDFLFNPGYSEEIVIFGEKDSASSYQLEFGATYAMGPNFTIDASMEITSNKVKFPGAQELSHKENILNLGTTFTF